MSFMSANLSGILVFEEDAQSKGVRQTRSRMGPGDTFEDLPRRARFNKHDKSLLDEWLALAAEREMQSGVAHQLDALLARLGRI